LRIKRYYPCSTPLTDESKNEKSQTTVDSEAKEMADLKSFYLNYLNNWYNKINQKKVSTQELDDIAEKLLAYCNDEDINSYFEIAFTEYVTVGQMHVPNLVVDKFNNAPPKDCYLSLLAAADKKTNENTSNVTALVLDRLWLNLIGHYTYKEDYNNIFQLHIDDAKIRGHLVANKVDELLEQIIRNFAKTLNQPEHENSYLKAVIKNAKLLQSSKYTFSTQNKLKVAWLLHCCDMAIRPLGRPRPTDDVNNELLSQRLTDSNARLALGTTLLLALVFSFTFSPLLLSAMVAWEAAAYTIFAYTVGTTATVAAVGNRGFYLRNQYALRTINKKCGALLGLDDVDRSASADSKHKVKPEDEVPLLPKGKRTSPIAKRLLR